MSIPFIDFSEQYQTIKDEVRQGLDDVFESGAFILGPQAKTFEEDFAKYCGCKHGIGVNSGTDALYLTMAALGVGPGDEVILPTHTFIATGLCISYTGAKPVFCDVEDVTYNLDPEKLEVLINENTKVILPVHIYGQAANMNEINAIAQKHGIKVVEDACQSHGALYNGNRTGSLGDVGCFSFYPTKSLGAFGDAGIIVTNSDDVAEQARMLRDYGRKGRYDHQMKGHNSRLDTVQAVVLGAKLKHLDQWNQMRRDMAAYYNELLADVDVIAPITKDDRTHVFQTYAIRVKNRDEVLEKLKEKDVTTLIHYPIPLHLQGAYKDAGHSKGDFPVAEQVADEVLSLPMFPHITKEQVEEVATKLKDVLSVAV